MVRVAVVAAALALCACAHSSGVMSGPDGRPIYAIRAPRAELAYNKAAEDCPSGYTLVSAPAIDNYLGYNITVECK